MKMLYSILLAIAFVLSINAQSKSLENLEKENKAFKKNKCKIEYDKFKDNTIITSSLGGTNLAFHTITAAFIFDEQILNAPIKSYLVSFTTALIIKDTSLIFIVNGERVKIGEALSKNQSTQLMSIDVYRQSYEFTPEQLEKFASAEKVEFQIGNLELKTQKDVSEKLKNLITLAKMK